MPSDAVADHNLALVEEIKATIIESGKRVDAVLARVDRYETALRRIAEWSDCGCEHDDENCCGLKPSEDYHCPGCIAARALLEGTT